MKNSTKKMKIIAALLVLLCTGTMQAQSTFSYLTPYDTIVATPDTLHWFMPVPAGPAFGTATMTVYYEGDFGSTSEYISIMDENGILLGATRAYFDGSDCMADSVTITFPASLINTWVADDTLRFSGITTYNVDLFCTTNHARIKLTYDYCLTGPVALVSTASGPVCAGGGTVALTVSPAGGTLSGAGASGNSTFDPQGLPSGDYTLTYNYTNAGGCTSYSDVMISILEGPFATALTDTVCPGGLTTLNVSGTGHIVWYADAGLTMPLDTGFTYITPALSTTTTFYAATTLMDTYFALNSFSAADSAVIDHDTITGDDRGGIAVTNNYIYVTGDDFTGRYDLDLNNPTQLPRRTALVSDLKTGQLYTFYNPVVGIPDSDSLSAVNITQLRTLNDDLTLGSGVITLSDSIPFGYDTIGDGFSGVFAGPGFTVIYSGISKAWYAIDLQDGVVTNLGTFADPEFYSPEDWAAYGVAEYNGSNYAVLYRDNFSSSINRRVLPDNTPTLAYAFSDVSDMANFTYAPWNNRLYMHYEGGGEFGGDEETLLYIHANDSTGTGDTGSEHINCTAAITITVDVCTDIKENTAGTMNIYPNPNNGVFTIGVSANMTNSKVEIISLEGRLVYSEILRSGQTTKEVDLTALAKGLYYVRISNDTDVITQKLVKY